MTTPNVTCMQDLHCILHLSEGSDMTYETDWYQSKLPDDFDTLTVDTILLGYRQMCGSHTLAKRLDVI